MSSQRSSDKYPYAPRPVYLLDATTASLNNELRKHANKSLCLILKDDIEVEHAPNDKVEFQRGDSIILSYQPSSAPYTLHVPYKSLYQWVLGGAIIRFEQGGAQVIVNQRKIGDGKLVCRVIEGGIVQSHDMITIPNCSPNLLQIDEIESFISYLRHAPHYPSLIAAIPYTNYFGHLRHTLDAVGMNSVKLAARIPSPFYASNSMEAIKVADAVLLDYNADYPFYYTRQVQVMAHRLGKPILPCNSFRILNDGRSNLRRISSNSYPTSFGDYAI